MNGRTQRFVGVTSHTPAARGPQFTALDYIKIISSSATDAFVCLIELFRFCLSLCTTTHGGQREGGNCACKAK